MVKVDVARLEHFNLVEMVFHFVCFHDRRVPEGMVVLVINLEHGVGSKGNSLAVDLLEIHILWTTLRFFLVDSATSTVSADDFVRQSKANLTVRIITIARNGFA